MKKLLLIALIFSAYVTSAQTQFAIGIKGGLNFANLKTSGEGSYDGRTGFHAGAFAVFKVYKLAIQPEVILSQQGTKLTINDTDFESNFNYINIPIIAKYYVIKHLSGGGVNVQVGPQLGILQSAKADIFDSVAFVLKKDQNVKKYYKKSDVSLCIGAGWDTPFGMSIDFRYNVGLRKIGKDEDDDVAIRNQVFQISVGFKLLKFGY